MDTANVAKMAQFVIEQRMRLWSVHPKFLDAKGLVALWREGLLAQRVLAGKTKGYRHHPQLERFKKTKDPLKSIGYYLYYVLEEANLRNYHFDRTKISKPLAKNFLITIPVTLGQLEFETNHLRKKLQQRNPEMFLLYSKVKTFSYHPIFLPKAGDVEHWEKVI